MIESFSIYLLKRLKGSFVNEVLVSLLFNRCLRLISEDGAANLLFFDQLRLLIQEPHAILMILQLLGLKREWSGGAWGWWDGRDPEGIWIELSTAATMDALAIRLGLLIGWKSVEGRVVKVTRELNLRTMEVLGTLNFCILQVKHQFYWGFFGEHASGWLTLLETAVLFRFW